MQSCSCARTIGSAPLFNMVGFQTKLKHGEQTRIFRTIPGLEKAEFARLAGFTAIPFSTHPSCLTVRCGSRPSRACASPARSPAARVTWNWQRSGSSPAGSPQPNDCRNFSCRRRRPRRMAHCSGISPAATWNPRPPTPGGGRSYQPMNVNFGLFPPLRSRAERRQWATAARHRENAGEKARAHPACARRPRAWIAGDAHAVAAE